MKNRVIINIIVISLITLSCKTLTNIPSTPLPPTLAPSTPTVQPATPTPTNQGGDGVGDPFYPYNTDSYKPASKKSLNLFHLCLHLHLRAGASVCSEFQ